MPLAIMDASTRDRITPPWDWRRAASPSAQDWRGVLPGALSSVCPRQTEQSAKNERLAYMQDNYNGGQRDVYRGYRATLRRALNVAPKLAPLKPSKVVDGQQQVVTSACLPAIELARGIGRLFSQESREFSGRPINLIPHSLRNRSW